MYGFSLFHLEQPLHSFLDSTARTGEVDAHALFAGVTESLAVVEAEVGVADEPLGELLVRKSEPLEVDPEQVGGLVAVGAQFGQLFGDEPLAVGDVVGEVVAELVEPVGAVGVSGLGGDAAEEVAVDVHGVVEEVLVAGAQFGVGDDDLGGEHAGEVEGLAGGHAGDGILGDLVRQGGDGRVALAAHHQVRVDLVAHEQAVVAEAEFGHTAQFLGRPTPSHRVVRIAEDHHLRALLQLRLQVVVVHHVCVALDAKRVEEQLAVVRPHHLEEGRIDGRLDQHAVALVGEVLHQE